MRTTVMALCLVAVLAGGCGGSEAADDLEPQALVLGESDLPQGFELDRALSGPVDNAEIAQGRAPGYEDKLEEWGRVGGFSRLARRRGAAGSGVRAADAVTSAASVYEDEDGATDSFATGVGDYEQAGFASDGRVDVGDEGRAFRGAGTTGGRQVEYRIATWRSGRVIASVITEGRPGRVASATVRALARRQQRRIRAALGD